MAGFTSRVFHHETSWYPAGTKKDGGAFNEGCYVVLEELDQPLESDPLHLERGRIGSAPQSYRIPLADRSMFPKAKCTYEVSWGFRRFGRDEVRVPVSAEYLEDGYAPELDLPPLRVAQ